MIQAEKSGKYIKTRCVGSTSNLLKRKDSRSIDHDRTMLILFPQTSILLVRKLCCMCLRTMKRWSRWSLKEEVHHETCFQNPQSCSWLVVRSNKFGPQDPNRIYGHQKPTCRRANQGKFHTWRMESSFCVCLTLAIAVLQSVLKWCRKEHKENQVKKESQQSQDHWWIWLREAVKGLHQRSPCACLYCIRKRGEDQTRKSKSSEFASWEER